MKETEKQLVMSIARVLYALILLKDKLTLQIDYLTHSEIIPYESFVLDRIKEFVKTSLVNKLTSFDAKDFVYSMLTLQHFRENETEIATLSKEALLKDIILPFFTNSKIDSKWLVIVKLLFIEALVPHPDEEAVVESSAIDDSGLSDQA